MARPACRIRVPNYCRHAARNLGYIRLDGQVIYLPGPYGSPESRAEYDRLLAGWIAGGRQRGLAAAAPSVHATLPPPPAHAATAPLTVKEFILAYLKYAQVRYAKHGHFYAIRCAFKPMRKLFGDTPVVEFGPKRFKEVRAAMIERERKLKRREINTRMRWIRNGIRWAVAEEMIPGEVLHRLEAVEILRRDEAPVPESEAVRPVDEALALETIKHASEEVAAMARLQMLTGARSGEVCILRSADIDMTKDVWIFRPHHHKTKNRGKERSIPMGPRAQDIIKPFLVGDPLAYLFSPVRAEARRREKLHEQRVTPPGAGNNVGTNVSAAPARSPGDRYTSESYGRAITRAIDKAFPLPRHLDKRVVQPIGRKRQPRPETEKEWRRRLTSEQRAEVKAWRRQHHWHPHQLRHTIGTTVRDQFGPDFAQAMLGHSNLSATQIYAAVNQNKAVEVARQVG